MAKIHGAAGAYPLSVARKTLYQVVGVLMLLMLGYGLFAGYATSLFGWVGAAVAAVLGAAFVYGSLELIGRRTTDLQKENQRFLRGAEGEQLVGWLLEELDDSWHVFHGIQLQDRQDLDHVIVGPGGLFYVQTKNLRGLFSVSPDHQPLYNNLPTNLLAQTVGQAMNFKERLTALLGTDTIWMNAILAVPFAFVEGTGQTRNARVLNQGNLVQTLATGPKRMSSQDVDRYVRAIEILANSARGLRRDGARLGSARSASTNPSQPQK